MSMFSMPEELMPDVTQMEKMKDDLSAMLPAEMSSAVNLMIHPLAGTAAMSALGIGVASHAFGLWMGTVSAAAEASQQLFSPIYDEFDGGTESFASKPRSPATKAKSATRALIEDARSAAQEIAGGLKTVEDDKSVAETQAAIPVAETVVDLMPEDFRQPKAMERPRTPDDLKAISGIGPKLEKVLNGLGVWTFAQIAGWSREEIAWVDDYLSFKGRIGRDDWIGQAAKLAGARKKH
jgi:NADH-quinone oxidoreductase subunit E